MSLQNKIDDYHKLINLLEELELVIELGAEDEEMLGSSRDILNNLQTKYEELRLETLFTSEYDANNAIVSLHAGAGGTEAQDWVEMLYRMYGRFAKNISFPFSF